MEELQSYVFYGELGPSDETVDFGSVEFVNEALWARQSGKYSRRFLAAVSPVTMVLPDAYVPMTVDAAGNKKDDERKPMEASAGASASMSSSSSSSSSSSAMNVGASSTSSSSQLPPSGVANTQGVFAKSTGLFMENNGGTSSQPNSNRPKLEVADAFGSGSGQHHALKDGGTEVQVI